MLPLICFRRLLGAVMVFALMPTQASWAADLARQIQSLDGEWEIIFDEANEGRELDWQKEEVFKANSTRLPIHVPSSWEEIKYDYEGVGFYGRHFSLPKDWEGKVVKLQFDAVNYIAEVYVNDVAVGRHEGGYAPFEIRVDDVVKLGEKNFVSLRVLGPIVAQDKVIDGIGWSDMPHWRGGITGGIWQSVRLIASGTVRVDDIFVQPDLSDDSAKVEFTIENTDTKTANKKVVLTIGDQKKSKVLTLVPGKTKTEWTLSIPDARYWSPEDPHLYTASISIEDSDTHSVKFGMRELTIDGMRFTLNGKPTYIKAAFFEGLYPHSPAWPKDIELARREIELARDAGFNVIRPWRKPPPPAWLDMCDEMGMMVIGGMPIECMNRWPTATPALEERIESTVREAVLRDRNRACIVQWEIFNEIHRPELTRLKHPMSLLTRTLDPTRLILDESGGFAGGANIYLPYEYEPERFNDVHSYPGAPFGTGLYDNFLTLSKTPEELKAMGMKGGRFTASKTVPGRLSLVSEIGYGSLPDLVDNNERFEKEGNPLLPAYRYHRMLADSFAQVLKEEGLDSIYPDLQQFCLEQQELHSQANKRYLEAIRSNSSIGGYCVHALTGGDWVIGAGLIDLFRNPKGSYWGTKEANQPRYLALQARPRNVYAAEGTHITITGINDLDTVSGEMELEVFSDSGKRIFRNKKDVKLAFGINDLYAEKLDTRELSGTYTARVKLTDKSGKVVTTNEFELDVFDDGQLVQPEAKFAILDTNNSLRPFLKSQGIPFVEFNPKTPVSIPVFVSISVAQTPMAKEKFAALEKHVKRGGTAVYLETVLRGPNPYWTGRWPTKQVLPVRASTKAAKGLWIGVSHIVRDHPVFDGLPTETMMGQIYENVWSPQTIMDVPGEKFVASVTHGWFSGKENFDKKNYLGPEPAYCGMDIGVTDYGKGRYVLSGLRVVENLGKDPVADKILYNLINWTTEK